MTNVLDGYVTASPGPQNALDIFKGQWTSRLPGEWSSLTAGSIPVFDDPRMSWGIEQVGGVHGKAVLELGPLEGGHSYMLENAGARSVLAIEGNSSAFLRCLVVKEILGLKRVHFLCGDFRKFLSEDEQPFDVIFASGVLYHMTDPVQLLIDISRRTRQVFLWTHYFEPSLITQTQARKFGPVQYLQRDDFSYETHTYSYESALDWAGFCGGSASTAAWLTRDSILGALRHLGFSEITIGFDHQDHPNGPALAVVARRD